jgi:hypothetical protein
MRSFLMLISMALAAFGMGDGVAGATGPVNSLNAVAKARFSTTHCSVAATGIIGGSRLNLQSPMVVNSVGAVGSGQDVAACVAWVNAGHRTVSAPIFVYSDVSDEQPLYVIWGDSLWVYDVATTRGPELLRLSNSTHRVLQRVPLPGFVRPTIAADNEGLWFGQGEDSQSSLGLLYLVGPKSSRPVLILKKHSQAEFIAKICVSGNAAWIEQETPGSFASTGYLIDRPGTAAVSQRIDPFHTCPVEYQTFGSPQ